MDSLDVIRTRKKAYDRPPFRRGKKDIDANHIDLFGDESEDESGDESGVSSSDDNEDDVTDDVSQECSLWQSVKLFRTNTQSHQTSRDSGRLIRQILTTITNQNLAKRDINLSPR